MPLSVDVISQRSCFRPSEVFRAIIDLTNSQEDHREVIYVVEGVSVRCYGTEFVDPCWVSSDYLTNTPQQKKDNRRVSRTLFKSQSAQVLERLVFLGPGGGKQFSISCTLPKNLPPSFKGTSVRYSYEVEIVVTYRDTLYDESTGSFQKNIEQPSLSKYLSFRKPFNILPFSTQGDEVLLLDVEFQGENEYLLMQWSELTDDDKTSSRSTDASSKVVSDSAESSTTTHLGVLSGSMMDTRSISRVSIPESEMSYACVPVARTTSWNKSGDLSTMSEMLIATPISNQMFNLRFGQDTLVLFSFNPSMATILSPGATLGGVLHLSEIKSPSGEIKTCQSYSVMLETEEEVSDQWKPHTMKQREDPIIRRLHCEHMEYTGDVLMTNFLFTIPSNAPPSFKTPLVSIRWVLRFEFIIASPLSWVDSEEMDNSGQETESLKWELPIVVHPR